MEIISCFIDYESRAIIAKNPVLERLTDGKVCKEARNKNIIQFRY
ncbi:hypothetical protein M7I_0406 [Glarea lozoyensis 74030]|uniref:Uncharacterized protein n=1 Tax=Glarea lozoyensis (strain ATCC 74030 / MF5533) TaxID=1104152 RepID=H0EDA2_GLAL7|nr:hypothetical protein M7I_0406 [Glarea lozoyensis 74030]